MKTQSSSTPISVHFASFPVWREDLIDKELENRMQLAQQVTSMILALRRKADIKVRQPLLQALIPVVDAKIRALFNDEIVALIASETNVKNIVLKSNDADMFNKKIKPNFKVLGAKCGKNMKEVAAKLTALTTSEILTLEKNGGYDINLATGEVMKILISDVEIHTENIMGTLSMSENGITLALDINITPDLRQEGIARELINRIQNLRKDSGFEVTDRISLLIGFADNANPALQKEISTAINVFSEHIKGQILSVGIDFVENINNFDVVEVEKCRVAVKICKCV